MERSSATEIQNEGLETSLSLPNGTLEVMALLVLITLVLTIEVIEFFADAILLSAALVVMLIIVYQNQDKTRQSKYKSSTNRIYGLFFALGVILYSWMLLVIGSVTSIYQAYFIFYTVGGIIALLFNIILILILTLGYYLIGIYLAENFLHLAVKSRNEEEWEYVLTDPIDAYRVILQALILIYITATSLVVFAWWLIPLNSRGYILTKIAVPLQLVVQINDGRYWFVFPTFRAGVFLLLTAVSAMLVIAYKFEDYEKKNLSLLMSKNGFYGIPLIIMLFIVGISGFLALHINAPLVVIGLIIIFGIIIGLTMFSKSLRDKKPRRHTCGRKRRLSEKNCPYCVKDTRLAQYYITSNSLSLLTCPICGEPKETVSRSCKSCNGLIVTRCPVCQWVISPIWNQCIHCGSRITPIPKIALSPREKPFANKTLIALLGPLLLLIPTYVLILFSFVTIKFNPFNIVFFSQPSQILVDGSYGGLLFPSSRIEKARTIMVKSAIITTVLLVSSTVAIIAILAEKSRYTEWLRIFSINLLASLFLPIISVFMAWEILMISSLQIIPLIIILIPIVLVAYIRGKRALLRLENYQVSISFLHVEKKQKEKQQTQTTLQTRDSIKAVKS